MFSQAWKFITVIVAFSVFFSIANAEWSVSSPDENVTIILQFGDMGGTADYPSGRQRLYYRVEYGPKYNRTVVINTSPLGIEREDQSFLDGLEFESVSAVKGIEESYLMVHGKKRECSNSGRELTVSFRNSKGAKLEVIMAVFNDGAAFRYCFPENDGLTHTVTKEHTGFALDKNDRCWIMPYDKPTKYTPAYEVYYEDNIMAGQNSPISTGWAFPILTSIDGGKYWALITEADVDESYCGSRLEAEVSERVYRIRFPEIGDGNGQGKVNPSYTMPWKTPWRVIMVGDQLADIVESTLVTDLSEASRLNDLSWIKPGRVSWSWCSDQISPKDCTKLKKFIDLAAEMGWEYSLIDANWTIMDNGTIHDLLRYAKGKNVGLLLWYNSGGPHNIVSEKPRGLMYYPNIRKEEMKMLSDWGVMGIKVDFFQSDKQQVISQYHDILADAAENKLMINFHGCTLPRGWSRTFPNLMSMEAVRGEECYIFDSRYPEMAPSMNTIYAFTRNVVGPMDYTPVGFSDNRYPHLTSYAHELALTVVFESGWLHFCDSVESYRSQPGYVKNFLKEVPVAWDETRLISGYPGKYIVIARRKANKWYIGAINGEKTVRVIDVDLSFIDDKLDEVEIIADSDTGKGFRQSKRKIKDMKAIQVEMVGYGGFVASVYKSGWF